MTAAAPACHVPIAQTLAAPFKIVGKSMIRNLLLASMLLLLGACADRETLPAQVPHLKLPIVLHAQHQPDDGQQAPLLEIKKRDHGVRFTLTGASGTLLAKQDLTNDGWQDRAKSDADYDARDLFGAVLFALTSVQEVRFVYPGVALQPYERRLEGRWQVSYASEGFFRVTLSDGTSYLLSPARGKASR